MKEAEVGPQGVNQKNYDSGWACDSEWRKGEKNKQMDGWSDKQMNYKRINTS